MEKTTLAAVLSFLTMLTYLSYDHLEAIMEHAQAQYYRVNSNVDDTYLLDNMQLDCDGIREGDNMTLINLYKKWTFNWKKVEQELRKSDDRCSMIRANFEFRSLPLSAEEAEYPLAYGAIVHSNIVQVLFMLSAFYHPQNAYCIAVDKGSDGTFHNLIEELPKCFTNIHVLKAGRTKWGSFEILDAQYKCVDFLSRLDHPWKYYQYLSGVDVPLKTNLEMVRIFKALNETVNFGIRSFDMKHRMAGKKISDSPITPRKSPMSALVPRVSIDYIVNSDKVARLLIFFKGTVVPDESFWGTVAGNAGEFNLPGALNVRELLSLKDPTYKTNDTTLSLRLQKFHGLGRHLVNSSTSLRNSTSPCPYFISWYATFDPKKCRGKLKNGSCVFGVEDVRLLLEGPEMIAHKFYLNFQPAAFFCVLKEISRRSRTPRPFSTIKYEQLPQVELKRGMKYGQLTHLENFLRSIY